MSYLTKSKSMLSKITLLLVICVSLCFAQLANASSNDLDVTQEKISLAGDWKFKLDPDGVGENEKWHSLRLRDSANLPGSLDEQGLGYKYTEKSLHHPTREYSYVGAAWFQKTVVIPKDWTKKRITLFLEKCHWETTAWVDGNYVGTLNSLSVPHVYDISNWMTPGKHTLTLRVDNTLKIRIYHSLAVMKWSHEFSDESQTNWNGIIGRLELQASDKLWVENIRTYPNFEKKDLRVNIALGNTTGADLKGEVVVKFAAAEKRVPFTSTGTSSEIDVVVPISKDVVYWDEFNRNFYDLDVSVIAQGDGEQFFDTSSEKIGLRDLGIDGAFFTMNGRKIFLRGKVDSAVFPLTAYPPTELKEWKRLLNIYKDYGINFIRFHSWVPVENAFVAADELGIVFQVEPPLWDGHGLVGHKADVAGFVVAEVDRIVDTFGNHPSFCLMSMGNELGNHENDFLTYLVDYLQNKDPRHYYTSSTHPMHPERSDDFYVAAGTKKGVIRGIRPTGNFDRELEGLERPIISHEVGQASMYPNFDEIAKYTGPLKAFHLEHYRDTLKENGIFDMRKDYQKTSGMHLVNIYKDCIEAQLRTKNMAGMQVLDIQDYPGHGCALIGILDAFCDSKGLITPKEFRRFCSPTVPLVLMPKQIWTNQDTFTAEAMVSHFGENDFKNKNISWTISAADGEKLCAGIFNSRDLETGYLTKLGKIEMSLADIDSASQLNLELGLDGTEFVNSWKFWVYPKLAAQPQDVVVVDQWGQVAKDALDSGADVLLVAPPGKLVNTIKGRWHSVFWSYRLFRQPPVMGAMCQKNHPALAGFPTDFYADWQWYDLLHNSEGLVLDEFSNKLSPIVQFVPDFNLNKKLSVITELRASKGRLIVATLNIRTSLDKRPAANALRASILDYMNSDSFAPKDELSLKELDKLLECVETIKSAGKPANIKDAVVNIKAAKNAKQGVSAAWEKSLDREIKLDQDFGYSVKGKVWKDARGSAWHNTNLSITVTCPPKFEGDFYAHFHDWSDEGRGVALFFVGVDIGPIDNYSGQGVWLKQTVTKEMSKTGSLRLDGRVTNGPNVVVSQIVLIPKK